MKRASLSWIPKTHFHATTPEGLASLLLSTAKRLPASLRSLLGSLHDLSYS